jgi:hypothetical protein
LEGGGVDVSEPEDPPPPPQALVITAISVTSSKRRAREDRLRISTGITSKSQGLIINLAMI